MPPTPARPGSARSAAPVNDRIRALARQAWGRPFTDAERVEYQALVVEWVEAQQVTDDVVEAA
ncbi:hypothetical protein PV355_01360 [Streptomyces stelliscabiei]|nr:hypothetical protein [Streptomyces stelliscabiei]